MPQARSRARPSNPARARAIRAVHEKFEGALIAEWNIRADSAKIRNAMQALPNRCRQCKKPAAGIGDTCRCKARTVYERWFSNPRNTLFDLLGQRCQSVFASASLAKFVEEITSIGVAGGQDLDWIEGQIQGLRTSLSRVCREWIIGVCPPPFTYTGLLPAWLRDHEDILGEDSHRSLSPDDSEAEFVRIEDEIAEYFKEANKKALDQASIQMAQLVRPVPQHTPSVRARQDLTAAMIAKIKRDNPEWSIEQICKRLDALKCPLRAKDRRAGFSSWHTIWKHPEYRNRIKRFVSQIQPAVGEK